MFGFVGVMPLSFRTAVFKNRRLLRVRSLSMTTKTKKQGLENAGGSVTQRDGLTTGRTRQEKRIGSGNARSGQARREIEVNARSTGRSRTTKRPASR
jgi:hypothetical protein